MVYWKKGREERYGHVPPPWFLDGRCHRSGTWKPFNCPHTSLKWNIGSIDRLKLTTAATFPPVFHFTAVPPPLLSGPSRTSVWQKANISTLMHPFMSELHPSGSAGCENVWISFASGNGKTHLKEREREERSRLTVARRRAPERGLGSLQIRR